MTTRQDYKISEITRQTGFSADTLRYYEKIGLLKKIRRTPAGVRLYSEADLSRLRFIQRAKLMHFSLDEIGQLLTMRENPAKARKSVRRLTRQKLEEVERNLKNLTTLRNELTLLVNLCCDSNEGCPIIDHIDDTTPAQRGRQK